MHATVELGRYLPSWSQVRREWLNFMMCEEEAWNRTRKAGVFMVRGNSIPENEQAQERVR